MKYIYLGLLLLLSNTLFSQTFSVRYSKQSRGIAMQIPVNTATKGNLLVMILKDNDRHIMSFQYAEDFIKYKKLSVYGGAGIHTSVRYVLRWKQDANTIFLAGPTATLGLKYQVTPTLNVAADINGRTDIPIFGGCTEHRYCNESSLGGINLSVGIKL